MREAQLRSQREISEKRQELLAREELLRSLEARLAAQQGNGSPASNSPAPSGIQPNFTPGGQENGQLQ